MQQLATFLMIMGFGSMGLNLAGMEFRLLSWIDTWGPGVGWALRAAFAIVGVALFFVSRRQGTEQTKAA